MTLPERWMMPPNFASLALGVSKEEQDEADRFRPVDARLA